jgi:hypothetical protein
LKCEKDTALMLIDAEKVIDEFIENNKKDEII